MLRVGGDVRSEGGDDMQVGMEEGIMLWRRKQQVLGSYSIYQTFRRPRAIAIITLRPW